jgi:glycosyltransferase involved in cell wall biosynthesis
MLTSRSEVTSHQPDIALFVPLLLGGGAERVMVDLAGGFAERGLKVDLVLGKAEGVYLPSVSRGVNIVDLSSSRTLTALPRLARYLRRTRPKALMATLEHANVVALIAGLVTGHQTRLVIREANTPSASAKKAQGLPAQSVSRLMRWLYPKADGIVAVSEGVAADLSTSLAIPQEKVSVILNPVLTKRVFELAQAPNPHPWFDDDVPVILSVGRLTTQKDFPTLIRAFAKVRSQRQARLIILGEGKDQTDLETLAQSLGVAKDVHFAGFADNPFAYMARASVYVLSSIYEGLPNALIQAMALGTPAVATDCPSGPKEVLEGGRYGALVPMGNCSEMAAAILKTLESGCKAVDDAWCHRYDVDTVIDQYLDLLGLGRHQSYQLEYASPGSTSVHVK